MRQQKRKLVHRERIFSRPRGLVPHLWMRRSIDGPRDEFVPGVREHAAFGSYSSHKSVEHEKTTGHLPSTAVTRRGAAPVVGAKSCSGSGNAFCNFFQLHRIYT